MKILLILFLSLAIFGCSNTPKVDPNGKLRADNQSAGIYYDYFGKKVSYDEYMKVKSLVYDMELVKKNIKTRQFVYSATTIERIIMGLYSLNRIKEIEDFTYSTNRTTSEYEKTKKNKISFEKYTDLLQKENNETITEPYSPKELIRISEKRAEVVEKEEKKQAIEESGDEHYTLMGFKEIRQDTPQTVRAYMKNEIYDKKNFYQKQQYYQSVIEPFIEGHDIRNEKDLYNSIAFFMYGWYQTKLFDKNKDNKKYIYEFGTTNIYNNFNTKQDLWNYMLCVEYATYFKGIASDMYQLDSYTTYDQDDFLHHIWNTFYIDGEWWHSDSNGDSTFISSFNSEIIEGYSSSDLPKNRKPTKEEIAKLKKKLGLIRITIYENPSSIWDFGGPTSSEVYAERNPDNFQNNYSKDLYRIFLLGNKINERYGYPIGINGNSEVWGNAVYDNDEDVNEYRKLRIKDMENKKTTGVYSNVYKPYVEALKRVEENKAKNQ